MLLGITITVYIALLCKDCCEKIDNLLRALNLKENFTCQLL